MSFVHGKAAIVLFGLYNISGYTDNAETPQTIDTAETTTFGNSAKTYIPGLRDATVSLSGTADYASGAIDDVLAAAMAGTQTVLTILPNADTVGNRAQIGYIRQTQYAQSIPVGDKVSWTADLQADGGIDNGVVLHALEAETGTENGTTVNSGAASTNGYSASLHVTSANVTSVTIKVQHSTDGNSWSDLCTFTAVSGTTSELKTGTGTVNQYVRYIISAFTGTTLTFVVALARR